MSIVLRGGAVVIVASLAAGCGGANRNLKITEVHEKHVELYLDEPADQRLTLQNVKLRWLTKSPSSMPSGGALDLGRAGSLRGGRYFVVWEDDAYDGDPIAQQFAASVPGIKVPGGFFPAYGDAAIVSIGVDGAPPRPLLLGRDRVSDVVRFGPIPRPEPFGTFHPDASLAARKPAGNRSISRAFAPDGAPVDTDSESDWVVRFASPGAPTP